MAGRALEVFEEQNKGHCDRLSVQGSEWQEMPLETAVEVTRGF